MSPADSGRGRWSLCVQRILACFRRIPTSPEELSIECQAGSSAAKSLLSDLLCSVDGSLKHVSAPASAKPFYPHAESQATRSTGKQHETVMALAANDKCFNVAQTSDGQDAFVAGDNGDERALSCSSHTSSVNISDLEPSTEKGESVEFWLDLAEQIEREDRQAGEDIVPRGQLFRLIPDAAIIGKGTYGIVWHAKQKQTGEMFAVKNVEVTQSQSLSMQEREREMVIEIRKCSHPCIVRIHSICEFSDLPELYSIIMEYCPGGSILDRVAGQRGLVTITDPYAPPALAQCWLGQVFLGLEHLHLNSGMLHGRMLFRDLKPDNVVLDASDCAKLTDFGLGRIGGDPKGGFSLGVPAGTPGYIAPEILRGERHDFKADLFSFGVLIWLLLTGGVAGKETPQPPHSFDGVSSIQVLLDDWRAIQDHARNSTALRRSGPFCDQGLILELLERHPAARPDHDGIRAHPFIQQLGLPAREERPQAVKAWLLR